MLLLVMAAAMPPLRHPAGAVEQFRGRTRGLYGRGDRHLQSLREIPGFLAFAVVFLLLVFREQTLAFLALLLGIGTAITGAFPTVLGLTSPRSSCRSGSIFETVQQSLALQWGLKARPQGCCRLIAVGSFASLAAYALVWTMLKLMGFPWRRSTWRAAAPRWRSRSSPGLPIRASRANTPSTRK